MRRGHPAGFVPCDGEGVQGHHRAQPSGGKAAGAGGRHAAQCGRRARGARGVRAGRGRARRRRAVGVRAGVRCCAGGCGRGRWWGRGCSRGCWGRGFCPRPCRPCWSGIRCRPRSPDAHRPRRRAGGQHRRRGRRPGALAAASPDRLHAEPRVRVGPDSLEPRRQLGAGRRRRAALGSGRCLARRRPRPRRAWRGCGIYQHEPGAHELRRRAARRAVPAHARQPQAGGARWAFLACRTRGR